MANNAYVTQTTHDGAFCIRRPVTWALLLIVTLFFPGLGKADSSLQEAFEKLNSVTLLIDPGTGEIVDANAAAAQFYGYSRDHLRAMTIQQINLFTPQQVAAERKLAESEGRNFFIFRHQLADGSVRTVEVHSIPLEIGGRTLLHSIIHDISKVRGLQEELWHYQAQLEQMVDVQTREIESKSRFITAVMEVFILFLVILVLWLAIALRRGYRDRKKAEENEVTLNAILDGISDGIVFVDTERRIVAVNRGMEKTFGYTIDDLAGKKTLVLYEHEEEYKRQGRIRFNISAKKKAEPYEVNYRRKDGQVFVGETLGTSIRGADGQVLGYIGVMRDITERKRAEVALREAKEEAENASKAKSEFLASMSHELRTPLNAILGFAQMMQLDPKTPLSQTQHDHLESILIGGNHLLELVNEILDLARIEADQLVLSVEEVQANDVVADCVDLTNPLGDQNDITIIDRFSTGAPMTLRTDRMRLKQILLNLLSNAVKYNRQGGTVVIEGREIEGAFLKISVTDTGIGIAPDERSGVFQMFQRLGADPMVTREGTGIGLTVSKLLVEQLAGRIGFESEEGKGSTFWIELPLATNDETLIWDDKLRVGVDAIDKDHQILISLLNRATHGSVEDTDLDDIIDGLIDYTYHHFRREEVVMAACDYPDLAAHRVLHQTLIKELDDLADAWRQDHDPMLLHRLREFLRNWLFHHIIKCDAEIARHAAGKKQAIQKALEAMNGL